MPSRKQTRAPGSGSSRSSTRDALYDQLFNSIEALPSKAKDLDPQEWIEALLKIRTKDQQLLPLRLNAPQWRIYETIHRLRFEGKPVRLLILKARQEGVSTLIEALIFEATARHSNVNSLIVAHDLDGSDHLFGMSKLYYDKLPEGIRPPTQYSNRKELDLSEPLRSKINVDTANNLTAGRSYTVHNFHGSEVAFWNDAKTVMLGVSQAVPDLPGTMIVLESTANGVGGWFYDEWQRAKRGESDYIPLFIAWFELPEYRREVPPEGLGALDEEEQRLQTLYGVDDEQLSWRRGTIANKCGGDVELFHGEFPTDDHEAFLFSGRPVFVPQTLREYYDHAAPPEAIGTLAEEKVQENGQEKVKIVFAENERGYLRIWKFPEEGHRYAIGADVAEGLELGDYSTAEVLDRATMEQVAEWHGHIAPDLFAIELDRLGRFYHKALIGVEVNNHGLTTLTKIQDLNYPDLYQREILDQAKKVTTLRMGWQTNSQTKPLMVDEMARCIRERLIGLRSKELIEECMSYVVQADGKTGAQVGCFDDRVIGMAIAVQMYERVYLPREQRPKYPTNDIVSIRITERIRKLTAGPGRVKRW